MFLIASVCLSICNARKFNFSSRYNFRIFSSGFVYQGHWVKVSSSFLSFVMTLNAEAGMSQRWGPATKAQPTAHAPMYALVTVAY